MLLSSYSSLCLKWQQWGIRGHETIGGEANLKPLKPDSYFVLKRPTMHSAILSFACSCCFGWKHLFFHLHISPLLKAQLEWVNMGPVGQREPRYTPRSDSEGTWQEMILIIHAFVLGIWDSIELLHVLLFPTWQTLYEMFYLQGLSV